jgi:hypothetical protein
MHSDDDGDVVHSVMVQGPHGPYRSTYTVNAVKRYFSDAHSLAQKTGVKQVQNHPISLQTPNSVYGEGKHG